MQVKNYPQAITDTKENGPVCRARFPSAGIALLTCCFVVAMCGCGTSPSTAASSNSTNPSPPSPPPSPQHQVDLSWDAPASSPAEIIGYNVYRSPQGNSSFQRVNSSIDTETVYLDSLIQSGSSYSYFVTSVDAAGVESGPSNTIGVTIP